MTNDIEKVRQLTSKNEGCISDAEGELLYKLAKDMPDGQVIVEIGRGKGKSTVWLAKGSEAGNKVCVYSIASHKEGADHIKADRENTNTEFIAKRAGVQGIVNSSYTDSEEAPRRWKEKVGLLCINTSREYEDVKKVFLDWERRLSPNARVVVHSCDQPGPARVIKEYLGNLGDFTFEQSVGATTVVAVDKCGHHWIIDSNEIGICKYCGRTRNFKRMGREATGTPNKRRQVGRKKK